MSDRIDEQKLRTLLQQQGQIILSDCDLSNLLCYSINLNGAMLVRTNLSQSDLSGGYFVNCDMRGANLNRSKMISGDFRNVDLSQANLKGADLSHGVLSNANLAGANLQGAKLIKARLENVNFTGANLAKADLRGAKNLTAEQLESALHAEKAILDERMLAILQRTADPTISRHGKQKATRSAQARVDICFIKTKPTFGDVFQMCGFDHPDFPPTGKYGFLQLSDLGIEQVDDYFALVKKGESAIWIYPLMRGQPVEHSQGPFDGLRFSADSRKYNKYLLPCVERFEKELQIPTQRRAESQ